MSCNALTNFPYIDTGKVQSFSAAWRYCIALTDFPLLDFSSGNNFNSAWVNCSSLKHFPANAFDNCTATNFTDAFFNTNLSEQSIDGILESLDVAGQINGTFTQSGGEAPSSVGLAAKTSLEAKGWTISVTT